VRFSIHVSCPVDSITRSYFLLPQDSAGNYVGSGIGRIPLADLSTGGSLRKEFILYRNNGIALATGVGMSSMWYLMERGAAYCCSVLRWDDDQPYPVAAVRSIRALSPPPYE
jgi:hypothetical protein